MIAKSFEQEVKQGARFQFGRNWRAFLAVVDDERIHEAERSLQNMLGMSNLSGKSFLDIGCGSGLFSLAASRLGARPVHSFDYDPQSVACALELKRRYLPDSDQWSIERASVLDAEYLAHQGKWEIVYSWGVLHHTGDMWRALENVPACVAEDGMLFISIYNDQGASSRFWRRIKALYNKGPLARALVSAVFVPYLAARPFIGDVLRLTNPLARYRAGPSARGMSVWHDWFDWLGGYPFEVATPEQIFAFYHKRGFELTRLKTCGGGLGCNEFVFRLKLSSLVSPP